MTSTEAPTCPRHPDRVAMVRCQRCGRPTCPECQRPAAVGVQCVDCVRDQQREHPRATVQYGVGALQQRPTITIGIIAACVAIWLGQMVSDTVTNDLFFSPANGEREPWRFLTVTLVHATGSPLHLLFNMYALWILGSYLEPMLGRVRFAALYLICALGGSVGYELIAALTGGLQSWYGGTVGASGAIYGLFLAVLIVNIKLKRDISMLVVLLIVNGLFSLFVPNIAWQAHLGGAVVGALCAGAMFAVGDVQPGGARGRSRDVRLAVAWGAITVLLVVLAVAGYAMPHPTIGN